MKVLSYQCSGVAWVPYRIGRCLAAAGSSVEFVAAAPSGGGLESYGLPALTCRGDLSALLRSMAPDVLHLHHDVAAQRLIRIARGVAPNCRIIVTIHGEPDRSRGQLGAMVPDAYHVVAPDLASLRGTSRCRTWWIPNHPGEDGRPAGPDRRMAVWVPDSHVVSFKDHDRLAAEERSLAAAGIAVERERGIVPNHVVLDRLRTSLAVWVQQRGYLDLLTMEAMQAGCLPIVDADVAAWGGGVGIGFPPSLVNGWAAGGLATKLLAMAGSGAADRNADGMRRQWTAARVGARWHDTYYALIAG